MEKSNRSVRYPLCLIIMDGWGCSDNIEGNAILAADTPNYDRLMQEYPNTLLNASGLSVGLPEGQMGNSEVGHLNIGAGRIVFQELTKITKSIEIGKFFEKEAFLEAIKNVNKNNSALHLFGLLSDGGVHSHISHLKALIDLAVMHSVKKLYLHAFLDGRDVPPRCALSYIEEIIAYMNKKGLGELATISGRYYAMDRDNRWDRVKKAYDNLVYRNGRLYDSAEELMADSYQNNIDDEFVIPASIKVEEPEDAKIKSKDSIIFFNFRPDRAREITRTFIYEDFNEFDRGNNVPKDIIFVCMTEYDSLFSSKKGVFIAYPPRNLTNTVGEVFAKNNLNQLRIAETEKYAHVTFFFNGGVEIPNPNEDRILIPSPNVPTYNLKPEMSAYEIAETVVKKIDERLYHVIIVNFANPDMVGHTGFFDKAVEAIEVVDKCLGKITDKLKSVKGTCILTADHGNAEEMFNVEKQCAITAHSNSRIPFILCDDRIKSLKSYEDGDIALCDISPTMLEMLNIIKPVEMTGKSLIKEWADAKK
ncbi:MAG: 2,3-bisphosphoglycerate-independent phosphoglycerate mutase [Actinomycetota bacterium]|nr:2,3-bisphosphoglycerate-independent phosphoglycerate mutase [Actinomycetota bacterium]